MSLLHKSLEQLRRKEGETKAGGTNAKFGFLAKPKGKPGGATLFGLKLPDLGSLFSKSPAKKPAKSGQGSSKTRKALVYGVLLLAVLGVGTWAGLYFFSDLLIEDTAVPPRPARHTVTARPARPEQPSPAPAATPEPPATQESAAADSPPAPSAPEPPSQSAAQAPAPPPPPQTSVADHPREQAPAPAARKDRGQQDSLESHFTRLAKRNQEIMYLESSLAASLSTGDLAGARDYLDRLTDNAGEDSPAVLKWEGFLALKENRPADAEDWFRRALGRTPGDVESEYNLIVALMLQKQYVEAQTAYREFLSRHPSDPRIQRLGAMLGM